MTRQRRARTSRQRQPIDVQHRRRLKNPFESLRVLSEDHVAHIHQTAIQYLSDQGIRVLFDEARRVFAAGGAAVTDDLMVRLDPDSIRFALDSAPSVFEIAAPNPERNVDVGGRSVSLVPVGGPPFASDLSGGRRSGTLADQRNFLRLTQTYDVLAVTSPCVEPDDIDLSVRHLESMLSTLTLTDKVPFLYARGRQRVRDGFDLVKIRHGIAGDDEFTRSARCWTNINTNSPRQLDVPMSMGIIDFARMNQPCIMTPFTLAGAMAPVTLAGALVLQHMEVLAAVTLAQLTRPGAPVLYGAFTSNVDMKSGSPAFGTPEAMKGAIASGQLARHVGLPWRSSGSSTSNSVDAQAGYETMANTYGALLGGANWIQHAAGWQEGGLSASFEKFIVDVEMCQIIAEWFQPIEVSEATLALDAITDVGPGGHFFGTQHTLDRYETAFYRPLVFERTNFEQWTEEGSRRTDQRAEVTWRTALESYEQPSLDDSILEELQDFVARRTAEGGALPD
ncbi:MAG: trimethylamine methyltransferase family protein [Acidimicrobiales bacterium]|nr:trimethylamine methyltransferase family protein [Acidimicrobiales bacterium]